MSGWKYIEVDGRPAMVRVCYVLAWNDPDWRKPRRGYASDDERRAARRKTWRDSQRRHRSVIR